ncbi:hypothetical protein RLDS_13415 [Sphingobium lactosutens DS20]|uniref:Uncharacterized protein n=1 Tax=Sphingobium lactosutens DS20 TaxID=1331060 RepID=T0HQH3_9SPHN|nr:hypothetical protein RLDS_13415 [Sphingobium lactosutens DS20]
MADRDGLHRHPPLHRQGRINAYFFTPFMLGPRIITRRHQGF